MSRSAYRKVTPSIAPTVAHLGNDGGGQGEEDSELKGEESKVGAVLWIIHLGLCANSPCSSMCGGSLEQILKSSIVCIHVEEGS